MNCKHGMEESWCAICNGSLDERDKEKQRIQGEREARIIYNKKRKELQNLSKEFAFRHKEELTDEELKKIVINTEGVEKEDIDTLFGLAKETNRRLGAIEWIWNLAWDERFLDYDVTGEGNKLYERVESLKITLGVN